MITISLGPEKIELTDFINGTNDGKAYTTESAIFELMKQGFLYDNIIIKEKQDPNAEYGAIIDQDPVAGTQVSIDDRITIFYNSSNKPEDSTGDNNVGPSGTDAGDDATEN